MPEKIIPDGLDPDQELILAVYSFYTQESNHSYLQYTAACAIFYYLTQKNYFDYKLNELLVYDYKESRRYIWEAKKFMKDINVLRDHDYLIRARSRSKTYRDVNAHQCSKAGHKHIEEKRKSSKKFDELLGKVRQILSTDRGEMYDVHLKDNGPVLVNKRRGESYVSYVPIQGFLKDLCPAKQDDKDAGDDCVEEEYEPFFI
ncbi:MAG: hypothetical protein K8R63_07960 [Bacteroidales bacterium]|nr:hypothetical protein [Bacteroidales bacterium]